MKPGMVYYYLFYKLFKSLQHRSPPVFTFTATILAMVALEVWAMISLIGSVGYLFGRELLTDANTWTVVGIFAVMLIGLNMLIFTDKPRIAAYNKIFDAWQVKEHERYGNVLQVVGYSLVANAALWSIS